MSAVTPSSPVTRERGFSMTELLVVVAIIAILISLLAPMLLGSRELANQFVCQANQGAAGLAVIAYTQDFDDHVPPAEHIMTVDSATPDPLFNFAPYFESVVSPKSTHTWADSLVGLEYASGVNLFACPSDEEENYAPVLTRNRLSYGINNYLYQQNMSNWGGQIKNWQAYNYADSGGYGNDYYGPKIRDVKDPQRTILITDSTQGGNNRTAFVGWHYPYRIAHHAVQRHWDKVIVSFMDGSVRHESFEDFYHIPFHPGLDLYGHFKLPVSDGGYGYDDGGNQRKINGSPGEYGWYSPVMYYGAHWVPLKQQPYYFPGS